jgi:hypothetical protein
MTETETRTEYAGFCLPNGKLRCTITTRPVDDGGPVAPGDGQVLPFGARDFEPPFEWGGLSAGGRNLARAILDDALGAGLVAAAMIGGLLDAFEFDYVRQWPIYTVAAFTGEPMECWRISADQVQRWAQEGGRP